VKQISLRRGNGRPVGAPHLPLLMRSLDAVAATISLAAISPHGNVGTGHDPRRRSIADQHFSQLDPRRDDRVESGTVA